MLSACHMAPQRTHTSPRNLRIAPEKLLKAFKPELKSSVELSGAVGQFTIGWADDKDDEEKPVEATENHTHQTPASRANLPLN